MFAPDPHLYVRRGDGLPRPCWPTIWRGFPTGEASHRPYEHAQFPHIHGVCEHASAMFQPDKCCLSVH